MKACVFARLNNLPLIVTGYQTLKIGPYLRREKSKRDYSRYFDFQKGLVGAWIDHLKVRRLKKRMTIVEAPDLVRLDDTGKNKLYNFTAKIHWRDFFSGLKEHRPLVIDLFWKLLRDEIREELDRIPAPFIGVHVRMGDFRKLKPAEKFRSVGGVRTPEQYFIDIINAIRKAGGRDFPVTVFTDGYRHELPDLFRLPRISMAEDNKDIIDMLLLSRSKIIVASAGSTFSYWSGFLSDAPLIMHPDHIHQPIRHNGQKAGAFEGAFDREDPVLIRSISQLTF